MGMRLNGLAQRLTVFVDEADRAPHSHKPLYCEIVHLAHQTGLPGPAPSTVWRAMGRRGTCT
jgi:PII-like signaling protein